jgi:type IV pilus assembly protein PilQ
MLQDRFTDAILICSNVARTDPIFPGLPEMQNRIMNRMNEVRAGAIAQRKQTVRESALLDVDQGKLLPKTYGARLQVKDESTPLTSEPTPMEEVLKKTVTVHLDGVTLADFILAMGTSEGINIISDAQGTDATMTLHADNVPLAEILDYVSRNLGIAFYVGKNIIWATPQAKQDTSAPMETRMYRLRKGLSTEELTSGAQINIEAAIERFIPKVEGADFLFDRKVHVLLVKNTRQNLARIEEMINRLDVCPPQILIEARFLSIGVNDLTELGIDWLLKSPSITAEKMMPDGQGGFVPQPKTQIDSGATIGFASFPNASQGLNMTYQGILTTPMFEAVLHALQISGKSQTLSAPKITTVNNRQAMIRIGEDFRYFDQFDVQSIPSSVTDAGTTVYSAMLVPVGTPQLEELGIELGVTPSVGGDLSSITLNMIPEISEFVRYETYEVGTGNNNVPTNSASTNSGLSLLKIPIFRRSRIETELIVQSGETVVMGGLVSATENKTLSKVPFLSALPIIGPLFTRHDVEEIKRNLMIFVTATLLSERGEDLVPIAADKVAAGPSAPVPQAAEAAAPAAAQ